MGKKTKEDKLKNHGVKRFEDLYGIVLTQPLHEMLLDRIRTRIKAEHIDTQSHRISIWAITITKTDVPALPKKIKVPVVYDKLRKMVISALPPECVDIHNIGKHIHEWT
jgi:hypothetical protein